jgi:hypothetical protein
MVPMYLNADQNTGGRIFYSNSIKNQRDPHCWSSMIIWNGTRLFQYNPEIEDQYKDTPPMTKECAKIKTKSSLLYSVPGIIIKYVPHSQIVNQKHQIQVLLK